MNPASVDIKDLMIGGISGLEFATNVFIGREPATPDNVVTIFDTPGFPPDKRYDKTDKYYRPSVQIRVRNSAYLDGWNLIDEIKELLHNVYTTVNGTIYSAIFCSQEPALLDWDDNNRARFVMTLNLQRTET